MIMWHYVRVRPERAGIVRNNDTGGMDVLDPRKPYRSDDPLVRQYPDAFAADTDLAAEHQAAQAPVERATRRPGEKGTTRRG